MHRPKSEAKTVQKWCRNVRQSRVRGSPAYAEASAFARSSGGQVGGQAVHSRGCRRGGARGGTPFPRHSTLAPGVWTLLNRRRCVSNSAYCVSCIHSRFSHSSGGRANAPLAVLAVLVLFRSRSSFPGQLPAQGGARRRLGCSRAGHSPWSLSPQGGSEGLNGLSPESCTGWVGRRRIWQPGAGAILPTRPSARLRKQTVLSMKAMASAVNPGRSKSANARLHAWLGQAAASDRNRGRLQI